MTPRAKTIQIFLPGGDPRGIRVAEMTTRIVQVIEVPRSLLAEFLLMPESGQVGLYFLFGGSEDGADTRVYIGQTGDVRTRLAQHNKDKDKDFWERAVVLISRTNTLTQTHALYLEWFCIQAAAAASRYATENGNKGSRPHTPAPLEADCLEIFETGDALLSTLGFPVFSPVAKTPTGAAQQEVFTCQSQSAFAEGLYTSDGMVVLKGAKCRRDPVASLVGTTYERPRKQMLQSGLLIDDGTYLVLQQDHAFPSPSAAAIAVLGRSANGWDEWISKDGKTLDALKRQSITTE